MKSLNQLMANSSGHLNYLLQHSQLIKKIDKIFNESLPVKLKQHCHVANLRDKTLIVHSDSSIWATQLRYMASDLLQQWQNDKTMSIKQLEIRVRPAETHI
jgi:hypothetical protein